MTAANVSNTAQVLGINAQALDFSSGHAMGAAALGAIFSPALQATIEYGIAKYSWVPKPVKAALPLLISSLVAGALMKAGIQAVDAIAFAGGLTGGAHAVNGSSIAADSNAPAAEVSK